MSKFNAYLVNSDKEKQFYPTSEDNNRGGFRIPRRSLGQIHAVGYSLVFLAMLLLIFNYLNNSDNLWHALITALGGIYLGLIQPNDIRRNLGLMFIVFIIIIFLILEYFILGLPDQMDPEMDVINDHGNLLAIGVINYYSPWIYLTIKCVLAICLWLVVRRLR